MSTSRHDPRNRQRPAPRRPNKRVFLIRRIVVLIVLIALIAAIWAAVASVVSMVQGFLGGNNTGTTQSAPGATIGACKSEDIQLTARVTDASNADKSAFDSGINPFFSYTITNTGGSDCTFDVGTAGTYYRVTSGSETIWTSENCDRTGLTKTAMTLKPNTPVPANSGEWYRVRSSSSGCGAEQTPVTAGGASYHLSVEVAGVKSKDTVQFVLN